MVVGWTEDDLGVKIVEGRIEVRQIGWTEAGRCEACEAVMLKARLKVGSEVKSC